MNNGNITLMNPRILFRNFSGNPSQFNAKGNRNFCVVLDDPKLVKALENDGWNIRWLKPRDPQDEAKPYMQVRVYFPQGESRARPPQIVLITSHGRTTLDEETVSMLDYAEIENIDMIIRPAPWEISGRKGIKGYLKSLYVTIVEDELEKKYAAMESSALSSMVQTDDTLPF